MRRATIRPSGRPPLSVLLAVREGMPFLPEVMESILGQTWRDFEVVVVAEPTARDGTLDYLKSIADARLTLVVRQAGSQSKALNLGLASCRADWIARIDADDPSHPKRLGSFMAAVGAAGKFGVVASRTIQISASGPVAWPALATARAERILDITESLAWRNPIAHSAAFVRRSVLQEIGGYDENLDVMNDYLTWVRVAEAGWRIGQIPKVLQAIRVHPGQTFAGLPRMHYVTASARVQWRASRTVARRGRFRTGIAVSSRLAYGILLPHSVRARIRAHLEERRHGT